MKRLLSFIMVGLIMSLPIATEAEGVQTKIDVRALSKGAKFIGTSMGGAAVTIKNARTGEILAEGKTSGSTGNTDRIMRTKHPRDRVLSTSEAARYTAEIELDEPTTLKITARGPLSHPGDANTVSTTQKVIPGNHLTGGDGVLLEIPGFVVDIKTPRKNVVEAPNGELSVKAFVAMMCGCPISPDGLWDANDYQLNLVLIEDDEIVNKQPMNYTGEPSHFQSSIEVPENGAYKIRVQAYDPALGNTGFETMDLHVKN